MQQATDKTDHVFDGIIESIFWVGPNLDMNSKLSKVPGLTINNGNDNHCLQYEYQSQYNKSVIIFLEYCINKLFLVYTLYIS